MECYKILAVWDEVGRSEGEIERECILETETLVCEKAEQEKSSMTESTTSKKRKTEKISQPDKYFRRI